MDVTTVPNTHGVGRSGRVRMVLYSARWLCALASLHGLVRLPGLPGSQLAQFPI